MDTAFTDMRRDASGRSVIRLEGPDADRAVEDQGAHGGAPGFVRLAETDLGCAPGPAVVEQHHRGIGHRAELGG